MQQKRHIQILKASLPYMHSPLREACRICVRMFEELETLDMVTNLAQMARLYREYESEGGAKHDDNTI